MFFTFTLALFCQRQVQRLIQTLEWEYTGTEAEEYAHQKHFKGLNLQLYVNYISIKLGVVGQRYFKHGSREPSGQWGFQDSLLCLLQSLCLSLLVSAPVLFITLSSSSDVDIPRLGNPLSWSHRVQGRDHEQSQWNRWPMNYRQEVAVSAAREQSILTLLFFKKRQILNLFFNWKKIALQCCVGFYCTTMMSLLYRKDVFKAMPCKQKLVYRCRW